jgi:UDP-N-acetylglucosamine diphosphorylase/glucosamine-1-phosphate N-acetyltransferase
LSRAHLVLFDDAKARAWAPFSLTRPIGELVFGTMTLRERSERSLGISCRGHVTSDALEGFEEPGAAPVLGSAPRAAETDRLYLSSRLVPEPGGIPDLAEPMTLVSDDAVVGWFVPAGHEPPGPEAYLNPDGGWASRRERIEGRILEAPWTLVRDNAEQIARDGALLWADTGTPPGVHRIGDGLLSMAEDTVVEPGVTVDLRDGPVRLEAGASVEGPARLVGPLWIGPRCRVFGGQVGASSIGPVCKIRGEVSDTVLLGFTNKAHDGYLGHALLGRWVNLGAMTTNSDLKNNYGSVSIWTPDGPRDTGVMKLGCFLGDHVKTGIGTVLNTGTVVGAGSNLFGGAMPPTRVPAFSWGTGAELATYRLDKFLEDAERAMQRRDVPLSPGMRRLFERAWNASAPDREAS